MEAGNQLKPTVNVEVRDEGVKWWKCIEKCIECIEKAQSVLNITLALRNLGDLGFTD